MSLNFMLKNSISSIGLIMSSILFFIHTLLLIFLKIDIYNFQIVNNVFFNNWLGIFKIDSMGLSWLYMSSFVVFICQMLLLSKSSSYGIGYNWVISFGTKSFSWYTGYLTIIHLSLTFLFLTDNIMIFYISFETTLLPFFLWIGEAAIRNSSWHAIFFLTFFTLLGSIGMLWAIGILYKMNQSFIISYYEFSFSQKELQPMIYFSSMDMSTYANNFFTTFVPNQKLNMQSFWNAFLLFTFSFLIKFPVFPVASWLPEAHVEASTEASVLLAAVLLKIAPFGFYKMMIPSFSIWYINYMYMFWIIGLFSSLVYVMSLLSQTDLKSSIAYTSIIHMSMMLCLLGGIFKTNLDSAFLMGALHSFCSAGLFFCMGFLYDQDKSKSMYYINGIATISPTFSSFFLMFNLINIGYPLIGSYISESLLFVVMISSSNHISTIIMLLVLYILTGSVFFMLSKVLFKSWKKIEVRKMLDLSINEVSLLTIILTICTLFGIFPSIYLSYMEDSIFSILEMVNISKMEQLDIFY